ncbi:MAG: hypothetical protein ABSH16_09110 [Sedimentisphaerales bacterium]
MVKAIRIISIAIFALAVFLLVYAVVFGAGKDSKTQEFIKRPGAVEQFGADKGKTAPKDDQISPLVKQAADLSKTLNPTPPPSVSPVTQPSTPAPMAPTITPKFNLVGTSYYPGKPGTSFALIDEPGQGLYWVREGNSVGHLLIEKVNDGSVTVRDSSRTFEMNVTVKEPWRNLVKGASKSKSAIPADSSAESQRISPAATPAVISTAAPQEDNPASPALSRPGMRKRQTDNAILRKTGRNVQPSTSNEPTAQNPATQQRIEPPQPQPVTPAEQAASVSALKETVQKQLNDANTSRVSPEEAKQMEELAKALEQLEQIEKQNTDPNK